MFLAIINDTYSEVKEEVKSSHHGPEMHQIGARIKKCLSNVCQRLCPKINRKSEHQETYLSNNKDEGPDVETSVESNLMNAKMDVKENSNDAVLDEGITKMGEEKLWRLEDLFETISNESENHTESLNALNGRLTIVEESLHLIVVKLDNFIHSIGALEIDHSSST